MDKEYEAGVREVIEDARAIDSESVVALLAMILIELACANEMLARVVESD